MLICTMYDFVNYELQQINVLLLLYYTQFCQIVSAMHRKQYLGTKNKNSYLNHPHQSSLRSMLDIHRCLSKSLNLI